jgi:chaperonin GroES
MKFQPLHDRVLIERLLEKKKTKNGIIIPDIVKEKPIRGKVVAIGNGIRNRKGNIIPLEVKIGNEVLFTKWAGTEIKLFNKDYLIMKEADILGILKTL